MADELKIDAELERIVYVDDATGLHNRRYLYAALRERVDWSATRAPVSLIVLSVDRPPDMRDSTFSAIMRELGQRLQKPPPDEGIVVRFATDAFGVLLPRGSRDLGLAMAKTLVRELTDEPVQGVHVTFSAGVAGRPQDGLTPAALLDAAARALRSMRSAGGNAAGFAPPPFETPDILSRLPARVTIGREQALARAQSITRELKQPAFVLVYGPPGYGKSRFLDDALRIAADAGLAAARSDCEESSRHAPYRSVGIVIERFGRDLPDLELRVEDRLSPEHLMALRLVCPNFFSVGELDAASELPNPQVAGAAILELFRLISRLRPGIVVAVNRAPLVDPSSLEVYRTLLGAPIPFLLLMSANDPRGAAEEGDSPLPLFLEGLRRQRCLEELVMGALTTPQISQLLNAVLPGRTADPALDAAIATKGKGNPLYVEEVLRAATLSGRSLEELSADSLPSSPKHAVLGTLAALPPPTREALHCASVMGSTFDIDILQEMLSWRDLEIQAALDPALHARVIRLSDPRVPEVLEFSSGFARRACYESLDMLTRRRCHQRLGRVCEARLPDDSGWLVEAALFHFERSGSVERPEALRSLRDRRSATSTGPVGARVQRLAPGTTPLSDDAQSAFDAMARALVGALRIGRLYPEGSQLAAGFHQQVKSSSDAVLAQTSPLTVAIDGSLLKVNGISLPIRPGSGREDLRNLLEDRLIASLTVAHGLTTEELDAIIAALSEMIPHSAMAVDHWDRFLVARGIRNADIVQRAYVAHRLGGAEAQAAERQFDPPGIKSLHETMRYLKAGVDSLKLYPPGHALVEESLRAAEKPFEALLKEYPSVTLAVAEGRLLANGKPIEARAMVETGEFVAEQITRRKVMSITFTQGFTGEELRTLAAFFALPFDDAEARLRGERMLVESDIRHFRFGTRVYARRESVKEGEVGTEVTENTVLPGKPAVGRPPKRVSVSLRSRADVRARILLTKPPTDLLTEAFEKSLGPLLEALNYGAMCDLAVQLVQHLCGAARDAHPENRTHALRIIARALSGTSLETQRMVVTTTSTALRELTRTETSLPVVRTLVETLACWVPGAAATSAFAPLMEVLRDGVAARRNNPATPPTITQLLQELGRVVGQKKFMPPLLERMRRGNRDDRELSALLLASLGEAATAPLVEAIMSERLLAVRQCLANSLKLIGSGAAAALGRHVQPGTAPARTVMALEVIELAGTSGLDDVFLRAMEHPDEMVRGAALAMLKRLPREKAPLLLRRGLKELGEDLRPPLIRTATEMKLAELGTDVCWILGFDPSDVVATACCHYFAAVPAKEAVPLLVKIVETRPRLFGMFKGYADDVRAAAVWALGQVRTEEARHILERAARESNPTVRMAAAQALKAKSVERPKENP
ncbi:MAG: diguanylate cyclase [Planctomycetes bacterium]|nr:diguanylate cyclase [Planctomycetota bacterium]